MSLSAMNKRLKAIEQRPSAQRPLVIRGGLPSGADMISALSRAQVRVPMMPEPADDPGPRQVAQIVTPADDPGPRQVAQFAPPATIDSSPRPVNLLTLGYDHTLP
jgi:hypothetical protein